MKCTIEVEKYEMGHGWLSSNGRICEAVHRLGIQVLDSGSIKITFRENYIPMFNDETNSIPLL
jgi:hypothetical protein